MQQFLKRVFIFSITLIIMAVLLIYIDFFRVFKQYTNYYQNLKVDINREMVCVNTYFNYKDSIGFDSFIFGNSRSKAFKCLYWKQYIADNSQPFHFDAMGEGIWGISEKINFIDKQGTEIKNALIIIDRDVLVINEPRTGHLFTPHPLISGDSKIGYYYDFFKTSLNLRFLFSVIDFNIFKEKRKYMNGFINSHKFLPIIDTINCDYWYSYGKEIKNDSLAYYQKLINRKVFYERPKINYSKCLITTLEIEQLQAVKKIFEKHNTKYKIVVSPIYDQIPLEQDQLELLISIFGENNVYDFSGKNIFTENISNYFESSHYRPVVANEIMKIVYK